MATGPVSLVHRKAASPLESKPSIESPLPFTAIPHVDVIGPGTTMGSTACPFLRRNGPPFASVPTMVPPSALMDNRREKVLAGYLTETPVLTTPVSDDHTPAS